MDFRASSIVKPKKKACSNVDAAAVVVVSPLDVVWSAVELAGGVDNDFVSSIRSLPFCFDGATFFSLIRTSLPLLVVVAMNDLMRRKIAYFDLMCYSIDDENPIIDLKEKCGDISTQAAVAPR